jgi:hypothetical protein
LRALEPADEYFIESPSFLKWLTDYGRADSTTSATRSVLGDANRRLDPHAVVSQRILLSPPVFEEAVSTATDAYVYGYPLVTIDMTRKKQPP